MLTPEDLRASRRITSFTCFTGTKVQILTPEEVRASRWITSSPSPRPLLLCLTHSIRATSTLVLSFLALLVQKYKY
jgi:hypothetical protein